MTRISPRYATLAWIAGVFLFVNTIVRIGLLAFDGNIANVAPRQLLEIFSIGLLYDLAALCYLLPLFALIALCCSNSPRGRRAHAVTVAAIFGLVLFGMFFVGL